MIASLGFRSSNHDFAMFLCKTPYDRFILPVYVDDMIIAKDDVDEILVLKLQLTQVI